MVVEKTQRYLNRPVGVRPTVWVPVVGVRHLFPRDINARQRISSLEYARRFRRLTEVTASARPTNLRSWKSCRQRSRLL